MSATEIVEEIVEAVDEEFILQLTRKQYFTHVALVGAFAGAVVGTIVHVVTQKRVAAKYETVVEEQVAQAKAFYSTLNKVGEMATPQQAVAALHKEEDPLGKAIVALKDYQKTSDEDVVVEETTVVEKDINIFVESQTDDDNFILEEEVKLRTDDAPYVINSDEFLANELEHEQTTITYYSGDGTLADERDQEIPFVNPVVGEDSLERFGHGSGDARIVYVRNERLSTDFEVVLHDGKYAHEVLGFEHSDGGPRARRKQNQPRKFRGEQM